MNEHEIKAAIARLVCQRFLESRQSTRRHQLVIDFENLDILDEMQSRGLLRETEDRAGYLPTIGTFALLGDQDELYKKARSATERVIRSLVELYRGQNPNLNYDAHAFESYVDQLDPKHADEGIVPLGLYLVKESGALELMRLSSNLTHVEEFKISEFVIKMRDPASWWEDRVRSYREYSRPPGIPVAQFFAEADYSDQPPREAKQFADDGFWDLINKEVAAKARPRFEVGLYADAVEWALKVVAEKVRARTGLEFDGSELMQRAFAPKRPLLVFDDPMPQTREAMQVGYLQIFAGTMTGIRNPKAHGMVSIDQNRCIHFLFLASLLASKVDEAVDAPPIEIPVKAPTQIPRPEIADISIEIGQRGRSGAVRTVKVSAVIENISAVQRITEYICTLTVPSACLTFESSSYYGEIPSQAAGQRTFRRTESDPGAITAILPGDKKQIIGFDLAIDQLKMKGTQLEGDFEGVLKEKITVDAVVQGKLLRSEKSVGEIFQGMI